MYLSGPKDDAELLRRMQMLYPGEDLKAKYQKEAEQIMEQLALAQGATGSGSRLTSVTHSNASPDK